jgi:hypothetical protein
MAFSNPAVTDFQNQFVRDFPYGTDINNTVLNSDITSAFQFTNVNIVNQSLFPDQGTYTLAYLLLAAHYLVLNLRASSQGINGQFNWLQNSKGVGQVNEAFSIPQRVLDNPAFSQYFKTNYGAQYFNLIWPYLSGQMFSVCGPANAL